MTLEGYEPGEVEAATVAAKLENSIVPHPRLRAALKQLRMHQLRSYPLDGYSSQPGHIMLLTGPPGAGKTTVLKLHKARFPDVRDADGLRITVVLAEMPTPCTKKGVVQAIYKSMGHAAPDDWNAVHIASEIADLAQKHHVRMIMLDEADRIFGKETDEVAKFLVSFLNNVRVSVVLAGAPEILALNTAFGLGRRTEEDLVLDPYRWDTQDGRDEFRAFLDVFDLRLGNEKKPVLGEFELAKRIYVACGGHIGIVSKLIVKATLIATEEGRSIDRKLLGEVWLKLQRKTAETAEIDFDVDLEKKEAKPPARIPAKDNPFLCVPARVKQIWLERMAAEKAEAEEKGRAATAGKRGRRRL